MKKLSWLDLNKNEITACIIALNEEEKIFSCITSIRDNGIKNILLIDTGSKDRTVEIALQEGVKVINYPFESFPKIRNIGLREVKTKYALYIDADERLIKKIKTKNNKSYI